MHIRIDNLQIQEKNGGNECIASLCNIHATLEAVHFILIKVFKNIHKMFPRCLDKCIFLIIKLLTLSRLEGVSPPHPLWFILNNSTVYIRTLTCLHFFNVIIVKKFCQNVFYAQGRVQEDNQIYVYEKILKNGFKNMSHMLIVVKSIEKKS